MGSSHNEPNPRLASMSNSAHLWLHLFTSCHSDSAYIWLLPLTTSTEFLLPLFGKSALPAVCLQGIVSRSRLLPVRHYHVHRLWLGRTRARSGARGGRAWRGGAGGVAICHNSPTDGLLTFTPENDSRIIISRVVIILYHLPHTKCIQQGLNCKDTKKLSQVKIKTVKNLKQHPEVLNE